MIQDRVKASGKILLSVCLSIGILIAVLAFHLISFVLMLVVNSGIVFGFSVVYSYFRKEGLPTFVQNFFVLLLISYFSKYHIKFYHQLINPSYYLGTKWFNNLKRVIRFLYTVIAFYAFFVFYHCYNEHEWKGTSHPRHLPQPGTLEKEIRTALNAMWKDENPYVLIHMSILVHLFFILIYGEYAAQTKNVRKFSWQSLAALLVWIIIQAVSYLTYCLEFYLCHSIIPTYIVSSYELAYLAVTVVTVVFWAFQVTLMESLVAIIFCISGSTEPPYFWVQNGARARILFFRFALLPIVTMSYSTDMSKVPLFVSMNADSHFLSVRNSTLFLTVLCSSMVHSFKTLINLKNGISRMLFAFWICYFLILQRCCQLDDDSSDEDSDVISITIAISDTNVGADKNNRKDDEDDQGKFRKSSDGASRGKVFNNDNQFGDQRRTAATSEDDMRRTKEWHRAKPGIGDSKWIPVRFANKDKFCCSKSSSCSLHAVEEANYCNYSQREWDAFRFYHHTLCSARPRPEYSQSWPALCCRIA